MKHSIINRLVGYSIGLASLLPIQARATESYAVGATSAPVTLEEAYAKALVHSDDLAIDEQSLIMLENQYRQAVGSVLPNLAWKYTYTIQDTSSQRVGTSTTSVEGTLLRRTRPESFFELHQPLFSGFREFRALKGVRAASEEARLGLDRARQSLLQDVAIAYFTAYSFQRDAALQQDVIRLLNDRIKVLSGRSRLGKSRRSELLSAQSRLAVAQADLEELNRQNAVTLEVLSFLTGLPPDTRLADPTAEPTLPSIEESLRLGENRPDIRAAEQLRLSRHFSVLYAQGSYWPSVDVTGRYFTQRVGTQKDVNWDVIFGVNAPLFEGGVNRATVKLARAQEIQADLTARRTQRLATQEIRTTYAEFQSALVQVRSLREALKMQEENYRLQQQDYGLGLVNNLQVLDTLSDLQTIRLRTQRAESQTYLNAVRLKVATGQAL